MSIGRNEPCPCGSGKKYKKCCLKSGPDMELPALNDKTPRQAVREELGRQQVNALLEDAERNCRASDGIMGSLENLQRVRRTLGLEFE